MNDKSLEFVKKRIASVVCNGMENNKYEHMNEIDFTAIASKIQFNGLAEVSGNLWKTKLLFENGETTEISVKYNPNAQFDYFSTEICCCDGTLLFMVELCEKIFNKILTGQSCYTPKMPKDVGEKPYNYDIAFEVGNFVFAEEYGEQLAAEDKRWMKSRFTVMLPIKCDFIEKQKLAQNAPFAAYQTEGKEEMKLTEYIESICQEPLSKYQKMFFGDIEQKLNNRYEISMPPRIGRTLSVQTIWAIEQWKRLEVCK